MTTRSRSAGKLPLLLFNKGPAVNTQGLFFYRHFPLGLNGKRICFRGHIGELLVGRKRCEHFLGEKFDVRLNEYRSARDEFCDDSGNELIVCAT